MMNIIEIITFDGCDTAHNLITDLEERKKDAPYEIKITVVPSADHAEEMGLYGSPTIMINGSEYQSEEGSNPGYY